jgi:hypothetical protein
MVYPLELLACVRVICRPSVLPDEKSEIARRIIDTACERLEELLRCEVDLLTLL